MHGVGPRDLFALIRTPATRDQDLVAFLDEEQEGRDPLEDGASMRAHRRDNEGWTPLHWAASEGWQGFAERLLDMQASTNVADPCGTTPLMVAAYHGHSGVLEAIVSDHRTDPHQENAFGSVALHYAAQHGHTKCIEVLCELGCEVDKPDRHDETPLSWAARNGHKEAVVTLCDFGADPLKVNFASEDCIEFARTNGHTGIVEILEDLVSDMFRSESADKLSTELSREKLSAGASRENMARTLPRR